MSGGSKFKDWFGKTKAQLTSLDNQPLGKAPLVIIFFLDLFILIAIFNGLDEHTKQLSSPEEYIPYSCREIVVNRQWNPTNRADNLSKIVVSSSTNHYPIEGQWKQNHPVCAPYVDLIEQIKNDKALIGIFENRSKLQREANELRQGINNIKGAYDTSLLETVAKQRESQPRVDAIKSEFEGKTNTLNTLQSQIASLERTIDADANVKLLWERLQDLQEKDRQRLITDLRRLNFWYPVKRLGMQLLFLLPLFGIFLTWNSASIRKSLGVQTLVSSHLLGVSFIPVFCKIVETIYDIIPQKILRHIIEFLASFKLIAVWHYIVIAVAVAVALFLIYVFQRKLFSREKLIDRRISKGECQHCGKHLPAESQACPFCGFAQFIACSTCDKPTHVYGKYCRVCGNPQKNGRHSSNLNFVKGEIENNEF